MIVKTFEFNPISENTYVAYDDTKECVIIDAGCFYPDEKEDLLNFIVDNGLKVKYLLNTHLHFDHVFGNSFIKEQFGLKTLAHKADQFLLDNMAAQMQMFGFGALDETPEVESFIDEKDTISFGNQTFSIFHVPGHSPGSIAFYNKEARCVFSGDVLFRASVGRSDLPQGDHRILIEGIHQKLLTLPKETIVYPGHGPATTIDYEMKNNPYL